MYTEKGTKVRHIKSGVIETIVGTAKVKVNGVWRDAVIYEGKDRYTGLDTTFVRTKEDFENEFEVI